MPKIPVGIRVEEELVDRLKNAVWYTGRGITITSVIESALEKAVLEMESHNSGKPFPSRKSEIPKSPKKIGARRQ